MIYFSHPVGNANSRNALKGLSDQDILYRFFTTLAVYPGNVYDRLSRIPGLNEISKRQFDERLIKRTTMQPLFEIMRLLSLKLNFTPFTKHEHGVFSVDKVLERLDRKVASSILNNSNNTLKAIYAYEDCALHSFRVANQLGMKKIYDLPIGYWRAAREFLENEKERWPEWASTIPAYKDSDLKLLKKDQEIELADMIFVASNFTASTLKKYPKPLNNIHVVPYGFPDVYEGERDYYNGTNRKLKLLFVGSLSQRKGIADIFSAVEKFENEVTLTLVGKKNTNDCKALNQALTKHNYIPSLSLKNILELMREHDVLLFPSLFEGFGLVITEAMSQGMPVITTNRTAGPEFIEDLKNGWLIEAGNTNALIMAIKNILDFPHLLEDIGRSALQTAKSRPWKSYSQSLSNSIIMELSQFQ